MSEGTGAEGKLTGSAVLASNPQPPGPSPAGGRRRDGPVQSDTFGGKTSLGLENAFLLLQLVVTHMEHPARGWAALPAPLPLRGEGRGVAKCHVSPLRGRSPWTLVLEPTASPGRRMRGDTRRGGCLREGALAQLPQDLAATGTSPSLGARAVPCTGPCLQPHMPGAAEKGGFPVPATAHLSQPGSGSLPWFGVSTSPERSLPTRRALAVLPAAPTPHLPGPVLPAASGSSFGSSPPALRQDLCAAWAGGLCLTAAGCSPPPRRSPSSVPELLPVGKQSPPSSFVVYFIFISRDFCTVGGSPCSQGEPLPPPLHAPLPSGAHGSAVVRLLPRDTWRVAGGC